MRIAATSVLGVALGMVTVGSILIVDHNTVARAPAASERFSFQGLTTSADRARVSSSSTAKIIFQRAGEPAPALMTASSAARTLAPQSNGVTPPEAEKSYQTMRIAVRLASALAFVVAALIVFYTMRTALLRRVRDYSLALCFGATRKDLITSLVMEALVLGVIGTALGMLITWPVSQWLLSMGISTTGRAPAIEQHLPTAELVAMSGLSIAVAILGTIGPARTLRRMNPLDALQPQAEESKRLLAASLSTQSALGYLVPVVLLVTYVAVRPFLKAWLPLVMFFFTEGLALIVITASVLWFVQPALKGILRFVEWSAARWFPLEAHLSARRMHEHRQHLVFSIVSVTLVFSLLTGLHTLTGSLKDEIARWANDALTPYSFFVRAERPDVDFTRVAQRAHHFGLHPFRLSFKTRGAFPIRLIHLGDLNAYQALHGAPTMQVDDIMLSRTLAARHRLSPGDIVHIDLGARRHTFTVKSVGDEFGYVAENGEYAALKSYALFADSHPLFASNLAPTVGQLLAVRPIGASRIRPGYLTFAPDYRFLKNGDGLGQWQYQEINRDFLIFDFIIILAGLLAVLGVANNMMVQAQAREREFSVLRSLGLSRGQLARLLVAEGVVIGIIAALLSFILGHALGWISVQFLDELTLFDYRFVFSPTAACVIAALTVSSASVAALYPSLMVARRSAASGLNYD